MEQRDILNAILTDKNATRREFLAGATALGLTVSAASVTWSQAAKAAPSKGGHMKIGTHLPESGTGEIAGLRSLVRRSAF